MSSAANEPAAQGPGWTADRLEEAFRLHWKEIRTDRDPDELVAGFLVEQSAAAEGDGHGPDFASAAAAWLGRYFLMELPRRPESDPERAFFGHGARLKSFYTTLLADAREERQSLLGRLGGSEDDYLHLMERTFIPALSDFMKRAVLASAYGDEVPDEIDWDEAIADFVDRELFPRYMRAFERQQGLPPLDETVCSRIFYRLFKDHFDSRTGLGVMEMMEVGEKHPEELERMRLMGEYEDIRSALLRLQLTGKISSVNYR